MKINTIQMAVLNPSGFGMPACGHASVTSTGAFDATTVVRERQTAVITDGNTGDVKGDMGLAAYPGTSAWSPPFS
jgi:hypothetical protein